MMDDLTLQGGRVRACCGRAPSRRAGSTCWFCTLVGVGVTAGLFVITDYYTSTRFRPVRTTARASQTGHATNIIQGLAQGFQSTAAPALLLVARHPRSRTSSPGIYGIGVAVMAQLSLTGLIVALGRVRADNRQRGRHRGDGEPAGGCAKRDGSPGRGW